jgi:hypothetical protein
MTITAGVLDLSANGLYLIAVQHGQISILAPIAALYPASTVLLALAGAQGEAAALAGARPRPGRRGVGPCRVVSSIANASRESAF